MVSVFPNGIDTFKKVYDLPPSRVADSKKLQELKMKPQLDSSEQVELNRLVALLGDHIISPDTWNHFASALVNMQEHMTNKLDVYIRDKQLEFEEKVRNFRYIGVYSSVTTYKVNNMVKLGVKLYLCLEDAKNISPDTVDTAKWVLIN